MSAVPRPCSVVPSRFGSWLPFAGTVSRCPPRTTRSTGAGVGADDDVVREPLDLERTRVLVQPLLDEVGERAFGAADRRDRAELLGEVEQLRHRRLRHETMPCSRRIAFSVSLSCTSPSAR